MLKRPAEQLGTLLNLSPACQGIRYPNIKKVELGAGNFFANIFNTDLRGFHWIKKDILGLEPRMCAN